MNSEMVKGEVWRDIPDYKGLYQASSLGRIKSLHGKKEKILRAAKSRHGYFCVSLCRGGKCNTKTVHRLVMRSFVGESDLDIDHINGERDCNLLQNLEYVTHTENSLRGRKCNVKKKNSTSKYMGVTVFRDRWKAQIKVKGVNINLGHFMSEEEAHNAYINYKKKNGLMR